LGIGHPEESIVILAELDASALKLAFDEVMTVEVVGDGKGQERSYT
jgi:hypothetical protein